MTEPEDMERQHGPDVTGEDPPRRLPEGWWIVPGAVLGAAIFVACAWVIF